MLFRNFRIYGKHGFVGIRAGNICLFGIDIIEVNNVQAFGFVIPVAVEFHHGVGKFGKFDFVTLVPTGYVVNRITFNAGVEFNRVGFGARLSPLSNRFDIKHIGGSDGFGCKFFFSAGYIIGVIPTCEIEALAGGNGKSTHRFAVSERFAFDCFAAVFCIELNV